MKMGVRAYVILGLLAVLGGCAPLSDEERQSLALEIFRTTYADVSRGGLSDVVCVGVRDPRSEWSIMAEDGVVDPPAPLLRAIRREFPDARPFSRCRLTRGRGLDDGVVEVATGKRGIVIWMDDFTRARRIHSGYYAHPLGGGEWVCRPRRDGESRWLPRCQLLHES